MKLMPPPRPVFILGLDIGQTGDPAALLVAERVGVPPARYLARLLRRYPLMTRYEDVIADVATVWSHPTVAAGRRYLVMDYTGVGRPVLELAEREGMTPVPVTTTPGLGASKSLRLKQPPARRGQPAPKRWRWEYTGGKRELATRLQVVVESTRLAVAAVPDAKAFEQELLAFRAKTKQAKDGSPYEAFEAGPGAHDDLVMAAALAIWFGETECPVEREDDEQKPQQPPKNLPGMLED